MWVDNIEEAGIPEGHIALMSDASALTAKLRAMCSSELKISLKSQKLGEAFADEQEILGIEEDTSLIRKVYLVGDGVNWVHGRVVVPNSTYQRFKIELDNMGEKPLGETLLYARQNVTRSDFQYAKVSENLWARRSVFDLDGHKLLVTEVFLPEIMRMRSKHNKQPSL